MSLKVGTEVEMHLAGQNLILAKDNKGLKQKLQAAEEKNKILREAVELLDCPNTDKWVCSCKVCKALEKVRRGGE